MSKPTWKVPFDKDGNHRRSLYHWDNKEEFTFVDPYEFDGTLTYCGVQHNNSTTNILFEDNKGVRYFSSLPVLIDILECGRIINGNQVNGTWYFKKQGAMIILQLKKIDE